MVFRLGLCRNGMGAEREMRFVACAELRFSFKAVELRSTDQVRDPVPHELRCGKQVDIL